MKEPCKGNGQLYYISPTYALTGRTIRLTVYEPMDVSEYVNWDREHPFMSLAEFYLWDENGNLIALAESNFSTNAQEPSEGPIKNICDNNEATFFHTMWTRYIDDYHYFEITLPDDVVTKKVSFGMVGRYGFNYQMPKRFIMSGLDSSSEDAILSMNNNVKVHSLEGRIAIEGANGRKISVYGSNGQTIIANHAAKDNSLMLNVPKGSYIVVVGNECSKAYKVVVK